MNQIAQARRKLRFEKGAMTFANKEFTFALNPKTDLPLKYKESLPMASKQLVEEYMLLANTIVAEFLESKIGPKTLLRVHDDIPDKKKVALAEYFQRLGLDAINLTDSASLNSTVAYQLSQIKDLDQRASIGDAINRKLLGGVSAAYYNCIGVQGVDQTRHYGLNFDRYTHFTSPIRRYADLLVHRLLTICLSGEKLVLDGLDYGEYVDQISTNSYNARKASKDCVTLFHCLLLKEHGPRVFDALVYDLEGNFTANIHVKELNQDLVLNVRDDPRVDSARLNDDELSLVVRFRKCQPLPNHAEAQQEMHLQIFDRIKVKLYASDGFPLEIKSRMLVTREDMDEYETVLQSQQKKSAELEKLVA